MQLKTILLAGSAAFVLTACGDTTDAVDIPTTVSETLDLHEKLRDVSAATYSLERTHAFLSFEVGHNTGLSNYRVAFTDFTAALDFDPANPEAATLTASINPMAVESNYPGDYKEGHADSVFESWNEDISRDAKWLNADVHPSITFTSTGVTRTGDDTGTVTGDLTFLGQSHPVTLDVTFNGSANAPWFGERDLLGFNASTEIMRSEWGMGAYIPFVSDSVKIRFSGEFLQDE